MFDAITAILTRAKADETFHRVADERWARVLDTGKTVAWNDAKTWLEARSRGENPRRPPPTKTAVELEAWRR